MFSKSYYSKNSKGSKGTGKGSKGSRGHDDDDDASWRYVNESSTMEVEGTTFDKKTGKKYPCAECGELFGHREMLISRREQHKMEWEATPESLSPEAINEAKGKREFRYKRVCEDCEMNLRKEEGLAMPRTGGRSGMRSAGRPRGTNGAPVASSTSRPSRRWSRRRACPRRRRQS